MPINIFYRDFKVKEAVDAGKVKSVLRRDISWGTYIENLEAAKQTCGEDSYRKWKETEPRLTNTTEGRASDPSFTLTFPDDNFNFEDESIDHFIGTVAGDVILHSDLTSLEVRDFEFTSPSIFEAFPGPNMGIDGIYNDLLKPTIGDEKRPVLAFTVKPRFGLSVKDLVKIYTEAASAGIDIVEEDERLVDPKSCPFNKRVPELAKAQKDFPSKYSVNITGDSIEAIQKLDVCAENGIRVVKVDVLVSGFETLRKVSQRIKGMYDSRIAITVYPDVITAYRKLHRDFILRLSRLCGADIIYAGSPTWSRFQNEEGFLNQSVEPIYARHQSLAEEVPLAQRIKTTLPTITNDQHPSRAEALIAHFRKYYDGHYKYGFFVGGGISGFPADIKTSVELWMQCIRHASTADLSNYENFDFSLFERGFSDTGWDIVDVKDYLRR